MTGRKSVRLLWRKVNRRAVQESRARVNINQIIGRHHHFKQWLLVNFRVQPENSQRNTFSKPEIFQKPLHSEMTVTVDFFSLASIYFHALFFFVSTLCRFFFIQQFFEFFLLGWWVSAFHQYKRGTVREITQKRGRYQWRAIIFGALLKFCAAC